MSTRGFVLGSDIGTSSCKSVLLDARGSAVASASCEYPSRRPRPGWVEQDPDDWYAAFCQTARQVLGRSGVAPQEVLAVAIVGVTHNPVLLGEDGGVLRPAIHFWDKRSVSQVHYIQGRWGPAVRSQALNNPDPLWTWPQLLWVREHEPVVWSQIAALLFPKDYVRQRLGQRTAAGSLITDTVDPTGTLLYDPRRKTWIAEFIVDLDLSPAALPAVHQPTEVVDRVGSQGAADSGLVAGTPLIAGTTDTAAEVLGAGAVRPGQGVVKLASVGRIMLVMDRPLDDPHSLNYPHVIEGLWYPGSVTKHGAGAYRWARHGLWPELMGEDAYKIMDRAAAEIAPGSQGLLFLPHLSGEYAPQWDPELRGGFLGLTVDHQRAHMTRAVLEGVAYQVRAALNQITAAGGRYDTIRLIGGGANSRLWAQIMADVLKRELLVPVERSAAYGAGMLAGIAVELFPESPDELTSFVGTDETYRPRQATVEFYEELAQLHGRASEALVGVAHALERLDN